MELKRGDMVLRRKEGTISVLSSPLGSANWENEKLVVVEVVLEWM